MKVYALMCRGNGEGYFEEWPRTFSSLDEVLEKCGSGIVILTFGKNEVSRKLIVMLWGPQALKEIIEDKAVYVEVILPGVEE